MPLAMRALVVIWRRVLPTTLAPAESPERPAGLQPRRRSSAGHRDFALARLLFRVWSVTTILSSHILDVQLREGGRALSLGCGVIHN